MDLPATAIHKDYLGSAFYTPRLRAAVAPGFRLPACSASRQSGVEGLELNVLGLNFGVSQNGIKVPLLGRIGSFEMPNKLKAEDVEIRYVVDDQDASGCFREARERRGDLVAQKATSSGDLGLPGYDLT